MWKFGSIPEKWGFLYIFKNVYVKKKNGSYYGQTLWMGICKELWIVLNWKNMWLKGSCKGSTPWDLCTCWNVIWAYLMHLEWMLLLDLFSLGTLRWGCQPPRYNRSFSPTELWSGESYHRRQPPFHWDKSSQHWIPSSFIYMLSTLSNIQ